MTRNTPTTTAKPAAKAAKKAAPKKTAVKAATTATQPSTVVRFPRAVLAYLSVAVEGPCGPGGIAHRKARYPIIRIEQGRRYTDELLGAACGPTTTRPGPNHHADPDNTETIPVTICRDHSASFAQLHGVTRCTKAACWPLRPGEPPTGGGVQ